MHKKMNDLLAQHGGRIDGVFFCPHGPDDHCHCRKPKIGLFQQIARRLCTELNGVPAVGDSFRDIQAANQVGAKPYLVLTGKGKRTLKAGHLPREIPVFENLISVVETLLTSSINP